MSCIPLPLPPIPPQLPEIPKQKGMCEEISYDEIYMPSEMDGNSSGNRTRPQSVEQTEPDTQQATAENDEKEPGEVTDEKSTTHPPKEIVEDVMRHVENALSKERDKKTESNTPRQSESSENDKERKEKDKKDRSPGKSSKRRKATRSSPTYSDSGSSRSSKSRSRSPRRSRRKRRRSPSKKRARSSSSSSRGTYDDFDFVLPEDECPFACRQCHRGFYTIKELAEHEVRAHDMKIPCAHCDKNAVSITKLAAHMLFRHPSMEVVCYYCDQKFGGPADRLDKPAWDDFRGHVYKEILKKKMYEHSSRASGASSDAVALRGVGRCPHGAAVKCKNFPNCPGAKCIYSHGQCRYDITCNKSTCPFDHTNRPRVCMACLNDMKNDRHRRRY
ncbi:hypothetical protein RB195_008779 [Necator americanus]|uniref:C2H2-type domain-containing protein n=1 Tax=Necator americanus TaxID=51031 RepID=A0ABR1CRG5_NECAM